MEHELKTFGLFALLLVAVFGTFGPDELRDHFGNSIYRGTVHGVAGCVSLNSNDLVSTSATRDFCSLEHQIDLFTWNIGAKASLQGTRAVLLDGSITNRSDKWLVTYFEFRVDIFNHNGEVNKYLANESVWIEPGSEHSFLLPLDGLERSVGEVFPNCNNTDEQVGCWSFQSTKLKGVSL